MTNTRSQGGLLKSALLGIPNCVCVFVVGFLCESFCSLAAELQFTVVSGTGVGGIVNLQRAQSIEELCVPVVLKQK